MWHMSRFCFFLNLLWNHFCNKKFVMTSHKQMKGINKSDNVNKSNFKAVSFRMSWKSYSVLHVCEDGLDEPKTSHRKSVASRFILVTRPQPHSKSCAVLQKGEEGKRFCPLSKAMVKTWSPGRGGSGRALFLSSVARGEYRHPHWHRSWRSASCVLKEKNHVGGLFMWSFSVFLLGCLLWTVVWKKKDFFCGETKPSGTSNLSRIWRQDEWVLQGRAHWTVEEGFVGESGAKSPFVLGNLKRTGLWTREYRCELPDLMPSRALVWSFLQES